MPQLQDALAKDEKIIAEDNKTIQEVSGCAGLPADVPCWRSMVCRGSGGGRRGEEVMMRHSVSRWGEQESAEIEDLKKKLKEAEVLGTLCLVSSYLFCFCSLSCSLSLASCLSLSLSRPLWCVDVVFEPWRCWIDVGQDALAKSKKLVEEKDKTIEEVSGWAKGGVK
jgi:hypothetical protein